MNQEIITKRPGDQSMDKEINSLVIKFMTNLKLAEEQGENPESFDTKDFSLMKAGEGRFCDVFTCYDKKTKQAVAVKIFKDTCKKEDIEREVSMLEEIALGNPFSKFTVKFLKQCDYDGRTCLVFEKMNPLNIMDLSFIRILAIQEIITKRPGDQSMDKEINSLVIKFMTNLKLAEEQGENPESFDTKDFSLMKAGEGRFCDVFTCYDKKTKQAVAVKIFKDTCKKEDIEREVSMLEEIALGNPFSKFTVKFLKQCDYDGRTCLVFEKMNPLNIMDLSFIRILAIQLLLALDELKALNILHADIHPGNIMIVSDRRLRDCLKLIDFSMAIKASDAQPGMDLQTLEYRAPEIFLGLPFTEAIDVWGVGCTLASFYLGHSPFSGSSEDQVVERIVELLGQPEDHLLRSGKYTQRYFMEDEAADGPTWRLRNPGKQNNSTDQLSCLEDLFKMYPREERYTYHEHEDLAALVDLLKQMLHVDANQRISARQALKHPFITMDLLTNHFERAGYHISLSEDFLMACESLSEYLKDKSANWTPFQEFHVVSTHWDQEGRVILYGSSSSYTVLEKLGEGYYSTVVRCQNRTTKEEVAVKIPKVNEPDEECTGPELAIFEEFRARNPDSNYIIRLLDRCEYHGRTCLVFELLDRCIAQEICDNGKMTLRSVRPIAKQLLLALDEFKALNIRHKDLHGGNVMFVNMKEQPHRIKLIDFGRAIKVDEVDDEAIVTETDMSCVGCILVFLHLASYIHYAHFDIERELGIYEESECKESECEEMESEEMESEEREEMESEERESEEREEMESEERESEESESEHSQVQVSSTESDAEPEDPLANKDYEDRVAFADLLKQMMHLDANQRISPCQALQHPFITMEHLINRVETREYLEASQAIMNECPLFSADTVKSSSVCPPDQKSSGSPDGVPVTSSEGVKPTDFTPDDSASSGGLRKLLQRIHRFFCRIKNPDRKIPTVPDENRPDVCPSDGKIPPVSDQDNSEVCLSGGGLPQCSNDEELLTARSSEGAKPTDFTPDDSASSGGLRKLLQRIHRFFCRIKNPDRKIPTVPDENHPDVCPSDGEIPPVSHQDNSEVCLSGGGLPQCFNDEELLTARSSEGAKPTDFTPDDSASSGGLRKLLQRISRVKNFLFCCLQD